MIRSILPQALRRRAGTAGANRIIGRAPPLRLLAGMLASMVLPLTGCTLFQDLPDASIVPPSSTTASAPGSVGTSAPTAPQPVQSQTTGGQAGQSGAAPMPPPEAAQSAAAAQHAEAAPSADGSPSAAAVQPASGATQPVASADQPPPVSSAAGTAAGPAAAADRPQGATDDPGEAAHAVPVTSSQIAPAPAVRSPLSLAPSVPVQGAVQVAPTAGAVAGAAPTGPAAAPVADSAAQYQPAAAYAAPGAASPSALAPSAVAPVAANAVQSPAPAAAQALTAGAGGAAAPVQTAAPVMAAAGAQIPGPVAVPASPAAPRHVSVADQLFAREAALDALAELNAAQMAQGQAQSATVKQFAARVLDEYGRARQTLMTLAGVRDDPDTASLDAAHQRTLEQLSRLHGEAFDAGYVRTELAAHQRTAELYEWILGSGRDPSVKGYAVGVLPTVLQELEAAQSLMVQMGSASE